MDSLLGLWWPAVLWGWVLFFASLFYFFAVVENKGKRFLKIPFFTILGVYIVYGIFAMASCRGEGCMVVPMFFIYFPILVIGLLAIVPLCKFIFSIFRITNRKRFFIFWFCIALFYIPFGVLIESAPYNVEFRAINKSDLSLCDKIKDGSDTVLKKELCKTKIARKIGNFEICKTFQNERTRGECLPWAAVRKADKKWCDSLENQEKLDCIASVDLAQNMCKGRGSYESCLKQVCENLFSANTSYYSVKSELNACVGRLNQQKSQ